MERARSVVGELVVCLVQLRTQGALEAARRQLGGEFPCFEGALKFGDAFADFPACVRFLEFAEHWPRSLPIVWLHLDRPPSVLTTWPTIKRVDSERIARTGARIQGRWRKAC